MDESASHTVPGKSCDRHSAGPLHSRAEPIYRVFVFAIHRAAKVGEIERDYLSARRFRRLDLFDHVRGCFLEERAIVLRGCERTTRADLGPQPPAEAGGAEGGRAPRKPREEPMPDHTRRRASGEAATDEPCGRDERATLGARLALAAWTHLHYRFLAGRIPRPVGAVGPFSESPPAEDVEGGVLQGVRRGWPSGRTSRTRRSASAEDAPSEIR